MKGFNSARSVSFNAVFPSGVGSSCTQMKKGTGDSTVSSLMVLYGSLSTMRTAIFPAGLIVKRQLSGSQLKF